MSRLETTFCSKETDDLERLKLRAERQQDIAKEAEKKRLPEADGYRREADRLKKEIEEREPAGG